jgi:CBS domain-containing protein
MSHPVVTVTTSTTAAEAARLLCSNGFTALPVVDEGRLVGIVTEADLIGIGLPAEHRSDDRLHRSPDVVLVQDVMTTPVESLTAGADLVDAARMMVDERIRVLPIVDGYGPVGILTRRDLLRAAIMHDDQELTDEICRQLAEVDAASRWRVSVQDGVAYIEDFGTTTQEQAKAIRLASAVPGIVRVHVRHQTPDPF